jgi:Peptidase C13 family
MISNETTQRDRRGSYLGTLLRLWTLRNVVLPSTSIRGSVLLLSVWLGAWILYDWWQASPDPQFTLAGAPLLAWYGLAILGIAAWLLRRSRPAPSWSAALALVAGLVPVPLLVLTIGSLYLSDTWLLTAAAAATCYALLYLLRGLRALTGARQRFASLSAIVMLLAFVWLSDALDVVPDLWAPLELEPAVASDDNAPADQEALLFAQSSKIDRALAAIESGNAPQGNAYFLGFAGVGEEKVFAQEIELAAQVIGNRYGVGSRGVSLINDARDLESAPLASLSALKYALKGLAAKMNVERDVLVLSISSHGSEDPAIAVSNVDLPFNDFTDEDLAQALQDSGIKWRVVILSACYAGAFIDSLKSPQTIVITAAAADRTSFGCGSDSDLTYFGSAFYRDALPNARTLREAFDKAKVAIAQRERREHVDASRPQAYFGSEMESKLEHLTQTLVR